MRINIKEYDKENSRSRHTCVASSIYPSIALSQKKGLIPIFSLSFLINAFILITPTVNAASIFDEVDAGITNNRSVEKMNDKKTPNAQHEDSQTQVQNPKQSSDQLPLTEAGSVKKDWAQWLDFKKPFYVGLSLTRTTAGLLNGTRSEADETVRLSSDNSALSYGLFAGLNYYQYLDFELRYHNYGEFNQRIEVSSAARQIQVNYDVALDYQSLALVVRPKWAFAHSFQVNAELGIAYINVARSASVSVQGGQSEADLLTFENTLVSELDGSYPDDEKEFSLVYGVGTEYKFYENYAVRYDYSRTAIEEDDLAIHALSAIRRF